MSHPEHRLHALDAVRAFALLLGIGLHATMSFFLSFPAQDVSSSTALGVSFYVIHVFRMSVFFLIAGFFARLLMQRQGVRGFVRNRALRIGVPMTVGWIVLAPATIAVTIWGLSRSFPAGLPESSLPAQEGLPLTHLWFLYYLCLFYVIALVLHRPVQALMVREGIAGRLDTLVERVLSHGLVPLAMAVPLCVALLGDPDWPLWFGIVSPDVGLLPRLAPMLGFGAAFLLGWLLHRQMALLDILRRRWVLNLGIANVLTLVCLMMIGPLPDPLAPTVIEGGASTRTAYAVAYALAVGYWTLGLMGAALRFCATVSPVRRYLADAAYWMYLVHLPIVFGLQALMMNWPLHSSLKFPLIVLITVGLLLASYHWLVRSTLIGEVLNGRRFPRGTAVEAAPAPDMKSISEDDHAAALALLDKVSKRYEGTIALTDLDLAVRPGELLALLGPNGAGKSTAIGLWLGILQPDGGQVSLLGGSPLDVHSRLDIGVMMQDVNLAPMLSAREHIALAASAYRDPLSVDAAVALAGIDAFANTRYGKLSTGQKRQVQFALAVCGRPRLLFLDEPTVGLDVEARARMWRTIRALLDDGRAIVLTTHYLEEAEMLADRVAVLAKGRLIAEGSVEAMRALVGRRRIRCVSTVDIDALRRWDGVVDAVREAGAVQVTAIDAEAVVRRLFEVDPGLRELEVKQASLAEAFSELTRETA